MVRNDHPLLFVLLSTAGLYAEGCSDGSQHVIVILKILFQMFLFSVSIVDYIFTHH